MRTLKAILAAALALALLAPPALASPATSGDFVIGAGYRLSPMDSATRQVLFSVVAVAPRGHADGVYVGKWLNADLALVGRVTCLDIQGNAAAVGGVITKGSGDGANWIGGPFLVYFVDGGTPRRGQSGPDVVSQTYLPGQFLYDNLPPGQNQAVVPADFPETCPAAMTLVDLEAAGEVHPVLGSVAVKDRS